jgi:hypothetical protein
MQRRVVCWNSTNFSEECITSIVKVDPEDERDIFLRNIG